MINQAESKLLIPGFPGCDSDSFFLLISSFKNKFLPNKLVNVELLPVPLDLSTLPLFQGCVQYPTEPLKHLWFIYGSVSSGGFPFPFQSSKAVREWDLLLEREILLECGILLEYGIFLACWWQTGAQSGPWQPRMGSRHWNIDLAALMDSRELFAAGCLLCCGLLFAGEGNLIFF